MTRRAFHVVAAAVLAASLSPSLVFAQDDVMRQARDRAQLEELMWRYVRALDTLNPDAYAAVYTAEGQFGSGPTAAKGHEALKKMIAGLRQRQIAARGTSAVG